MTCVYRPCAWWVLACRVGDLESFHPTEGRVLLVPADTGHKVGRLRGEGSLFGLTTQWPTHSVNIGAEKQNQSSLRGWISFTALAQSEERWDSCVLESRKIAGRSGCYAVIWSSVPLGQFRGPNFEPGHDRFIAWPCQLNTREALCYYMLYSAGSATGSSRFSFHFLSLKWRRTDSVTAEAIVTFQYKGPVRSVSKIYNICYTCRIVEIKI